MVLKMFKFMGGGGTERKGSGGFSTGHCNFENKKIIGAPCSFNSPRTHFLQNMTWIQVHLSHHLTMHSDMKIKIH